MSPTVVIVVQQETLRERPRIDKLTRILRARAVPFEIWKFGDSSDAKIPDVKVRNLMGAIWRRRPGILRYAAWMTLVFFNAWRVRRSAMFFAVGFDSAFPITMLPMPRLAMIFDNIDNVSLSYGWRFGLRSIFRRLERWIAWRSQFHVVPSRARWSGTQPNLRIVANTPSREALAEAKVIAEQRGYQRGPELTIYINGWMPRTRGIGTLLRAAQRLSEQGRRVKVLVAGRPSCDEANQLIRADYTENLGMLTNAEALAVYYRSDIVFIYYDPSLAINRLAESQKWTDCWATGAAFVTNEEVATLKEYVDRKACFTAPYGDWEGLARLLESLVRDRSQLETVRANLARMEFRFWDEAMAEVIDGWLALNGIGA